jgi:hypothetical protein
MHHTAFMQLCREASQSLGLADSEALGNKDRVELEGIAFKLVQDITMENSALLVLMLGDVEEQFKADVYETLFTMQGIFHGVVDAIFDYDDINLELLFRVRLPLSEQTQGDGLATVIRSFVWQVIEWRNTVLQGKIAQYDDQDEDEHADIRFSQDRLADSVFNQPITQR